MHNFLATSDIPMRGGGGGGGGGRGECTTFFGPQRGSHIDKQLHMHVKTLPRRQTTPYARLEDSPGGAAASPRP